MRAIADARLTTVPCFRGHYRPMLRAVLRLLASPDLDTPPAEGPPGEVPMHPMHRAALRLVTADLRLLREKLYPYGEC